MLNVIVNENEINSKTGIPECIKNVKGYFRFHKKLEWFQDPEVQRIVKDIDKCDFITGDIFKSPIFGSIPADKLSSGSKALILMLKGDNLNVYGTRCGDNCSEWLLRISEQKDIFVTFHHYMHFQRDFEAYFVDSDKIIHTRKEFVNEFYRLTNRE